MSNLPSSEQGDGGIKGSVEEPIEAGETEGVKVLWVLTAQAVLLLTMSGDEPTAAVSCSVVDSIPSSPPQDLVGSPSSDVPEIQSLTSEDDHDGQLHRVNHDHGPEQAVRAAVLSEDLKRKIIKQVEYYFSDENLPTDKYLLGLMKKNKEGFVPIAVIAAFKRMKKLTQDHLFITAALRESSVLVVSSNGKKVKRLHPISLPEIRDPKVFTILVENLPEDHSKENIQQIFGAVGCIRSITICDPQAVDKLGKSSKGDVLISNKLHALVEYETLEASEKAVATLNDERDWRNGMRVKLLKHLKVYQKPHWRGPDPDKNNTGRLTDQNKNSTGRFTDQNKNSTGRLTDQTKNSTGQPTDQTKNSTGQPTDQAKNSTGQPTDQAKNSTGQPIDQAKNNTGRPTDQNKNNTGRLTDHSCPEKNSTGRPTDQNGDEEIQNITEHHDDVSADEVNFAPEGNHQHKDKHGHRGRNQGRNRRQKYKGINGMGHGTTTSAHHIELSKPPPGPKMPDGTRGFTMGRGRPPTSNQSS